MSNTIEEKVSKHSMLIFKKERNYNLFPVDILIGRKLRNPKYGTSKAKNEPPFLVFSPTYKLILMALISLLTPRSNILRKREITYKDIAEACGVSIRTIKQKMPVIRNNFSFYFYVVERKSGRGFTYKLNPNFSKELSRAYENISST